MVDRVNAGVQLTRHPGLVMVQDTPKGRGIFTTTYIPAHTHIETSPVLILSPADNTKHISNTQLWFYTYNWPSPSRAATATPTPEKQPQTQALPLGLGSLFNHASARSRRHNTGFTRRFEAQTIEYVTLRGVEAGEELCICYGDDARLGFVDADGDGEREALEGQRGGIDVGDDLGAPDTEDYVGHIDASVFSADETPNGNV